MKRTEIPKLTPEQAADELVLEEVKKLIQKARTANQKADIALRKVYQAIEDMCIDLNSPTEAENADNLEQAIACYVQYGEYSLHDLMAEIRKQYTEKR